MIPAEQILRVALTLTFSPSVNFIKLILLVISILDKKMLERFPLKAFLAWCGATETQDPSLPTVKSLVRNKHSSLLAESDRLWKQLHLWLVL
jgi:hypothetical protein